MRLRSLTAIENDLHKIPVIEYLRGIAAFGVTWFHLTNTYEPESWVRLSGQLGWLGVEVFFVVSGFILPYSMARDYSISHFPAFILRRVVRLEPPYIVSIVLTILLWQISSLFPAFRGQPPPYEIYQVLAHLFYLIPFTDYGWIQPVYWTLAYEFAFYLSLGLLFPLVGTKSGYLNFAIISVAIGGAVLTGVLQERSLLFIVGMCLFRILRHGSEKAEITIVIGVLSLAIIARAEAKIAFVGLLTATIIFFFRSMSLRGILHSVLFQLGMMSYSLYLTHVPIGGRIVNIGKRFFEQPWQLFLVSGFALLVCLAFSYIFMLLVERPALRMSRRISKPSALSPEKPSASA